MLRPGAHVPLSPLSYATAECCLHIFLFLGSEGGGMAQCPPPYASGVDKIIYTSVLNAAYFETWPGLPTSFELFQMQQTANIAVRPSSSFYLKLGLLCYCKGQLGEQ